MDINQELCICAGIVTYNSKIDLLKNCIASIQNHVSEVVIIDNGSKNIAEISQLLQVFSNLSVISNNKNLGIATALNQIGQYASKKGYRWFLTLDQDSICPEDMISRYQKMTTIDDVGMVCPNVQMRVHQDKSIIINEEYSEVPIAISSGCLVRTSAWRDVFGFWDYLFIDRVDEDFCYALTEHNWRIVKANKVILNHEIGNPKNHQFLGWSFYTDSYPDFRYFYLARNTIIVNSTHATRDGIIQPLTKRILKIILAEEHRFSKLSYFIKGIVIGALWIAQRKNRNGECDKKHFGNEFPR